MSAQQGTAAMTARASDGRRRCPRCGHLKLPRYYIAPEFYVMPASTYGERLNPARAFYYAIRRTDKSLVFRAETPSFAGTLLENLDRSDEVTVA